MSGDVAGRGKSFVIVLAATEMQLWIILLMYNPSRIYIYNSRIQSSQSIEIGRGRVWL